MVDNVSVQTFQFPQENSATFETHINVLSLKTGTFMICQMIKLFYWLPLTGSLKFSLAFSYC